MNHRDLVLRLLQTGEQYNMDHKDLPGLAIKCVVLSLKYVNRKSLFEALFPEQYADWALVELMGNSNTLGDAEAWICLLGLLEWDLTDKDKLDIDANHAPLSQIKSALRANNLDMQGWSMACKVLLLQMVQGLQSKYAIEILTSRLLARNTWESTMQLLAGLCDNNMHLPDVYHKTLLYVLSKALVDDSVLKQTMSVISAQREGHTLNLRLRSMQMVALRPRLRDRLKTSLLTEHRKEQVDSQLGTWDSYTGWCHTHRFPNNLSDRVKRQLYFLSTQTTWEWDAERLLPNKEMADRVKQRPVHHPDLSIINWVIENLSMDGRPPFKEMMAFKSRCFASFPVVYVQRMTLTQVLKLYVSAYQPMGLWKDVWKAQIGILSPQIIRDVESFVKEHPVASGYIMDTLVG